MKWIAIITTIFLAEGKVFMKKSVICFFFCFGICKTYAAEMPFEKFFGNYKIASCKRANAKSEGIDLCSYKKFDILLAPANFGASSTHFSFSEGKMKPDFVSFSKISRIAKNEKYEELKDGSSHWWGAIPNDTTHLVQITNAWVKTNLDGTLNLKIVRINSSSDSESDEVKEILNHELTLKK